MRGLVIIGYRASGKTTAGRRTAAALHWPFIDLDVAWEQRYGTTIRAFFAEQGEAAFRDRESEILRAALSDPGPQVIATGGGVVLRPENRAALAAWGGPVVYLDAPVALLQRRLNANGGGRPSLTGASLADEVTTLLAERDPLYRATATTVVAADQPLDRLVQSLVACVAPDAGAALNPTADTTVEKPGHNSSKPQQPPG